MSQHECEKRQEREGLPTFDPPIPGLIDGVDEEEAALIVGLGLLVQRAGDVEYILHGILADLKGIKRAYTHQSTAPGGRLVKCCREALDAMDADAPVPIARRETLSRDLDICSKHFDQRNRYVHGCWNYDHDRQSWLTVKGSHDTTLERPETELASSADLWELALEFERLGERLIAWDIAQFGQPGDDDLGQPDRVSVKRL